MRTRRTSAAARTAAARLELSVQYAAGTGSAPDRAAIRRWVRAAVAGRRARAALAVRIVDEAEGRALNRRWRKRRRATNVLSFPSDGVPGAAPDFVGDIVVCAPVVEAEARAQGKSSEAHWAHMLVHGTLHLLGYDHDVDARAEQMEGIEREVLARLGYPDPYSPVPLP